MSYNPSKRKNPSIMIRQIQQGILEYKDEIGTVLIGIETRPVENHFNDPGEIDTPHELCGAQWNVGYNSIVGDRVKLCPRDIGIFKELIKYLEDQDIVVGEETKVPYMRKKKPYVGGRYRKVRP